MAEERKWKIGDDVSENDAVLDEVTFADLILAVHCNCKKITPEAVKDTMNEILDQRLTDTWYLIENNMEEIMARAREGREGQ